MGVSRILINELAIKHINRYEGLIKFSKSGRAGIREEECNYYLKIWKSILQKGCDYISLNSEEQYEVHAALEVEYE